MALDLFQFVDSISVSPVVRLDLNNESPFAVSYDGVDLSPPELATAWVDTLLRDGAAPAASAYANRMLRFRLELSGTQDAMATAMQNLHREMDRPSNIIRWQPVGASAPVFFRTIRSGGNRIGEAPSQAVRIIEVEVTAAPTADGLPETLGPFVVVNDPAASSVQNVNPNFETDVLSWTPTGGAIIRSTAQAHQGVASLRLTPDGVSVQTVVDTEQVVVSVGATVRFSAWVWIATARTVGLGINWYTSGGVYLSTTSLTPVAVSASTWTRLDLAGVAPATAGRTTGNVVMGSTPPASHVLHVDEAELRIQGSSGGMCVDLTGIKGDVSVPAIVELDAPISAGGPATYLAMRIGGTPSRAPFVIQAEAMTVGTDTAVQTNDTQYSNAGSNYVRVSFATAATMTQRLTTGAGSNMFPPVAATDVRGRYRMFARVKATGTGTFTLQYQANSGTLLYTGDVVTVTSPTTRQLVDLGFASWPLSADPVCDRDLTTLPVGGHEVRLYAARSGGSGTLDIDYLLFIPVDDASGFFRWPTGLGFGTGNFVVDGITETVYLRDTAGGWVASSGFTSAIGGWLKVGPNATNRLYVVRKASPDSVTPDGITDTTTVTVRYRPGYLYVRPAST